MELKDYLAVLVRRWRIVAAVTLLGVIVGIVVALVLPPSYTAEAQLFVSNSKTTSDPAQLYQSGDFYQQRATTYAALATSPRVTVPVVKHTGAPLTPRELAGEISADAPQNTVLVNVDVSDESPARAARFADAVAGQLGALIQHIETPPGAQTSPVKATVVRQADPPQAADAPNLPMIVALGVVAGLVLGVGLAVLRENMDTSVASAEELQQAAGLSILATVERDPAAKNRPIIQEGVAGPRREAYGQLRTNLQYVDVDNRPRVVVVTSAVAGEGKTSIAGNLAVTMGRQGRRVCLVDGDLRQPRVADYFGLVSEVGLTTVLIGKVGLGDVLQPAGGNLAVVASGEVPPNPSELLGTERMSRVLDDLVCHYDMVIVDAPPILPVTDAVVLAGFADGAIMVVRSGNTTRTQLAEAMAALGNVGVRVLGGVLNMTPARRRRAYGYGYHYTIAADSPSEPLDVPPAQSAQPQHSTEASSGMRPALSGIGSHGARAWRRAARTDRLNPVERR